MVSILAFSQLKDSDRAARKNKPSAFQNPKISSTSWGCRPPPFPLIPLPNLQISSFGIITKNAQHSKCIWSSINDGFNPEFSLVIKHGPAALMAKFDVKTAYRNIAVHPDDWVYSSVEDPWPILAVERVVHQTPTGVTNRLNQGHRVLGKPWGGDCLTPLPPCLGGCRSQGCHGYPLDSAWLPHGPTFFRHHSPSLSVVDEFKCG